MLLCLCLYVFLNCLTCYWSGFRWKDRLRGKFHFVFTICYENSQMAAPMDGLKPNNIACCLNAQALMTVQDIANADIISDLVNVYFITRPIGNDESDSDPELDLVLDEEVNGSVNSDSVVVDLATCVEGLEHLAYIIIPLVHTCDGPKSVSEFLVTCSCKLNGGQPCHTRYSTEELADVTLQYLSMTRDGLDIASYCVECT